MISQDQLILLILDIRELSFCYSACIKSMMNFLQSRSDGLPLEIIIKERVMWQETSVRSMGGMYRNCSVVVAVGSSLSSLTPNYFIEAPATDRTMAASVHSSLSPEANYQLAYCSHPNIQTEEEYFFAPTGNGSIVTRTFCADCGYEISRTSQYYD